MSAMNMDANGRAGYQTPSLFESSEASVHVMSRIGVTIKPRRGFLSRLSSNVVRVAIANGKMLLAMFIAAGIFSALYSWLTPRTYSSETVIFVEQPAIIDKDSSQDRQSSLWNYYLKGQLSKLSRGSFLPDSMQQTPEGGSELQYNFEAVALEDQGFVKLRATAREPEFAADLARLQAERFADAIAVERKETAKTFNRRFEEQLEFLESEFTKATSSGSQLVDQYGTSVGDLLSEEDGSKQAIIKEKLNQTRERRVRLESGNAVEASEELKRLSGLLLQAREEYRINLRDFRPKHPKMLKLRDEVTDLESKVRAKEEGDARLRNQEIANLKQLEQDLTKELAEAGVDNSGGQVVATKVKAIKQKRESLLEVQKEVLQKQAGLVAAALSTIGSVQIIEPALPALEPNELSASVAALFGGLFATCALWLAFVARIFIKEAEERSYPLPRSFVMHGHRVATEALGEGWYLPNYSEQEVAINS